MIVSVRIQIGCRSTKNGIAIIQVIDSIKERIAISSITNRSGNKSVPQPNNLRTFTIHFTDSSHNLRHRLTHSAASDDTSAADWASIASRHLMFAGGETKKVVRFENGCRRGRAARNRRDRAARPVPGRGVGFFGIGSYKERRPPAGDATLA